MRDGDLVATRERRRAAMLAGDRGRAQRYLRRILVKGLHSEAAGDEKRHLAALERGELISPTVGLSRGGHDMLPPERAVKPETREHRRRVERRALVSRRPLEDVAVTGPDV